MSADFIFQQVAERLNLKFGTKEYIRYVLGHNQLIRAYKREGDIVLHLGYNSFLIEVQFDRDKNIKIDRSKQQYS